MQDKEIFDFLKGLFIGLDFNNDAQYQQAIQQITSNPYLPLERKHFLLNQIDYEYHYRKEQIKKGKDCTDFSEFIYKLVNQKNNF